MNRKAKIYVAGHRGLVGSTIVRIFKQKGYDNIICKAHEELDLIHQLGVEKFFRTERPEYVILAAAKVGGIMANITHPADFLYENLMIQNNIIHCSYKYGVKKLLFLASSCIYPRMAPQPMKEEYLLNGKLEPTNEGYAIAKIAGLKMCQMYNKQYGTDYISVMPCNVYGIGDNFDPLRSHVVPALIRKFHDGKINDTDSVTVWGTGKARRELLYIDDLAEACLYLFESYSGNDFFNIGSGEDVSIKKLTEIIREVTGYKGKVIFDSSKPDGMPQKLMDVSKLSELGWKSHTSLIDGLSKTYNWYLDHYDILNSELERGI